MSDISTSGTVEKTVYDQEPMDQVNPETSTAPSHNNEAPAPTSTGSLVVNNLLDIPSELLGMMATHLNYEDAKAFRLTCTKTADIIPFDNLKAKRSELKVILMLAEASEHTSRKIAYTNAMNWARRFCSGIDNNGHINNIHVHRTMRAAYLNCYCCLKSLPRECFSFKQVHGGRSLRHKDFSKRFCIKCAITKNIWPSGTVTGKGDKTIIVCDVCGELERGRKCEAWKKAGVCSGICGLLKMAELSLDE